MAVWHLNRLRTLRARFLLALALVGILPLGLVGLSIATLDRRALAEQSAQELTGLARGLAGQLEVYLDDLLSATRAIAALPETVSLDPARQEPRLKELFHHYPQFARLSSFDLSGSRLASSHPGGAPSIAARRSFQTAARRGHQAWEVAIALSSGRASLLIHTPIRDADRRVVGVVGAVIDLENLSAVVGRVPVGGGGRVLVLDADGRVLLHPERTAVQERRDYSWIGVSTGGRPAGPATVRYQDAGEAVVAGYAPVATINWTVVVQRPEREILAPARRSWHLALAGLGTSTGLALLTAALLARTLTRPVHMLATAAQALAAGDAAVPPSAIVSNVDELRTLVEAFTRMHEAVIRREEALRQSEERYRLLFDRNPHPMWVYDLETLAFLAVSDAAVRHYSYTRDEFLAMSHHALRPPHEIGAPGENLLLLPPGLNQTDLEQHRTKDGRIIDVEISSHELRFEGRPARLVLAYDVTVRRRAEAEVERQRREAEILADLGRTLNASLDLDHVLQRVNEGARELCGSDTAAIALQEAGEQTMRLCSWDGPQYSGLDAVHIEPGKGAGGQVLSTGRPFRTDHYAEDPRISKEYLGVIQADRLLALLAVPIGIKDHVEGVLYVANRSPRPFSERDEAILQRLADQAAIAIQNARLYRETQRAYEELSRTQAQFLQAQKMEAVGRLAGGVAHDFNNLLTVIIGRSQLLLIRLQPADPRRQDVELMQRTAYRAATLTQQLLALSRKQMLQPTVLDLNAQVADMDKLLRRLLGEDIALATILDPALGRVKADRGQLDQVLLNLAVNARDAMPKGGQLTIETANVFLDDAFAHDHPGIPPGPYVRLAIRDTGIGMDAEIRSHLFEPFFTTKEAGKGTGLGLATVYGIVTQSSGHITVDSDLGQGTTFMIYLPRVEEAVAMVESGVAQAGPPRGTETVLLVEDDAEVRDLAEEILHQHGYTLLVAANSQEALQHGAQHNGRIDLLLTDVVMPGMSGPELADRLVPLHPEIRVLYMSGYTDDALGYHGVLDPGTALLPKPFTLRGLIQKVREVLQTDVTRREPA